QKAAEALESALKEKGLKYDINEGDGAFYGPKIDIKLKDALKRSWQCATIQCDFALPKRFGLSYVDNEGKEKQPIMLHRVLLGSLERFIGALIEHYNADFPLWLAPIQVCILPVDTLDEGGVTKKYVEQVRNKLEGKGIRVIIDNDRETLNKRIRKAEIEKIPYVAVVGLNEIGNQTVSVRRRKKEGYGLMNLDAFIDGIVQEVQQKSGS
ncbi:MAG: threonine--tRNA ligase, partial [Candidatus Omnitrophota bacterium]